MTDEDPILTELGWLRLAVLLTLAIATGALMLGILAVWPGAW